MSVRLNWSSMPGGPLHGYADLPGDKSVSHRALICSALASGVSRIFGFLEAEDTLATANVLQQLGVRIDTPVYGERLVYGVGLHGLRGSARTLDCGNAGTGMRLLTGLLAGQVFDSTLVGDASLSKRPMRRITAPLTAMGARIDSYDGLPPLRVHGGQALRGIRYELPITSAQVKSALLFAGLYAEGETELIESHPTRDYTERMLLAFGWPVDHEPGWARLSGGHHLRATDVHVPADFSAAAFFLVAASIVPGSLLHLPAVGLNPRRSGLLKALQLMGADIRIENKRCAGGETVADLVVRYAKLRGVRLPEVLVPDMIDEFPALFIAAAVAKGRTVITGAAELRVKESDRIASMTRGLRALGACVDETPDGAIIEGGSLNGGTVESQGDHRIAMSFAVAGLVAKRAVRINDCQHVATSFPNFMALARRCGLVLRSVD